MKAKNVLYAAVGAPVLAARKMGTQVDAWRTRVNKERADYTEAAEKALNGWAAEGEKVVSRISQGAVVEEISQKVDLDQAKEQVSKLRDQLEDMLDTWRQSFRPEEKAEVRPVAAKAPAAKKPAAKTTAAKKPTAKTTTTRKPAAKTATAKNPAAKKSTTSSTAKKAATRTTGAAKAKAS